MKIAIPVCDLNIEADIDTRFGRAKQFLIYDNEENTHSFIENSQDLNATKGAGLQTATNVIEAKANCIIALHCGPKAFQLLAAYDVDVYIVDKMTAQSALAQLEEGNLERRDSSDVEGHWV